MAYGDPPRHFCPDIQGRDLSPTLFAEVDSWYRPIGLMGYAGVGKDWLAGQLEGFTRVSFADRIRELLLRVDPWLYAVPGAAVGWRLSALVEAQGWDQAKRNPEVRRLQQELGRDPVQPHRWRPEVRWWPYSVRYGMAFETGCGR